MDECRAGTLDLGDPGVVVGVAMVIPRAVLGTLRLVVPENLVVLLGLDVLKPDEYPLGWAEFSIAENLSNVDAVYR